METPDLNARLNSISTQWTKLFAAHEDRGDAATAAQKELLLRYYGAVYRYLLGTLRDPAAAEEVTQEFAVRFLRGNFCRADPRRGRFRDFLKTAVRNLAVDYWRKKALAPLPLGSAEPVLADPVAGEDLDASFLARWREALLGRAWEELARVQQESGQPYYTVLRLKAANPKVRSVQLAEQLQTQLGKPVSADGLRQLVHRAREKFAELLVREVASSLQSSEPEKLEQELIELDLLSYCRSALRRRDRTP
jgi:RNA polymerase sigma-70 factor (ECF subfamily)